MPSERLGKGTSSLHSRTSNFCSIFFPSIVFVTGNAGKLREVREILAQGTPVEIESRDLDRECELVL
jgi:hypothetical protein